MSKKSQPQQSARAKSILSNFSTPDVQISIPSPIDFAAFLPWACRQFTTYMDIVVSEVHSEGQALEVKPVDTKSTKTVEIQQTSDILSALSELAESSVSFDPLTTKIQAVYDSKGNLNKMRIMRNKFVPRGMLQILQLIIEFHPFLKSITIDSGIDQSVIYEISKLIPLSNITELCLDNTVLKEANYYILLDNPNNLKCLSLSKCKINDNVVQKIAERLEHPQPASKTVCILYLSMNRITDVGVRSLAKALRSNRKMSYLNLAGNIISDVGANAIFDVLLPFPLTQYEITTSQARHLDYVKKKNAMISKLVSNDISKSMRLSTRLSMRAKSGQEKTAPKKVREAIVDNAFETAKGVYGERSTETFIVDVVQKNNVIYSNGNNSLAYINLAYNNLSLCSLKKIVKVLKHQSNLQRTPKGLMNLNIEGNPFDTNSAQYLFIIGSMIDIGLSKDRLKSKSLTTLSKKPKRGGFINF